MLHCRKEKKSDESKYNVLLFSSLESVVFIHKKELGLNIFKYIETFSCFWN